MELYKILCGGNIMKRKYKRMIKHSLKKEDLVNEEKLYRITCIILMILLVREVMAIFCKIKRIRKLKKMMSFAKLTLQ